MENNTKKRFLSQMLANVEQLEQGAVDLKLEVEYIRKYKIYILEQYTLAQSEIEKKEDE